MKTLDCKIKVRYSESGRRGLAQHSAYYNWFDMAQEALITSFDMSYKEIEDLGYIFVTLSEYCEYQCAAYYGEELTVRIKVDEVSTVRIMFSYEVIRQRDSKIIANASSNHVFVDNNFRPHSLKKVLPELYKKLESML